MPAFVDPGRCNKNWDQCFSARVCPETAFSLTPDNSVIIDWAQCGDCPGPCLNFCDGYAIMYDRNPNTFDILRRQSFDELSDDEALKERQQLENANSSEQETSRATVDVTVDTFIEEVINSDRPVIVDFWAPWCGPCKAMAPMFEAVASDFHPHYKFAKIDTEAEPQLAAQFHISSIPTLLVFYNGQSVDGAVGALSRSQLEALLEKIDVDPTDPADQASDQKS